MSELLMEVKNLQKHFPVKSSWFSPKKTLKAVDGVSFSIKRGETLGVVGESGCGKSTLGRTILQLHKPGQGEIWFEGKDITGVEGRVLKSLRQKMQIIFQDPWASLNPRMTIAQIIREPLDTHGVGSKQERWERVTELVKTVGLRPQVLGRYPHEFSGGQRQRIGIARALALNPSFIVADEPVSALDVSVQAQVLNLIQELQEKFGISFLFIAHDLAVVQHISHRVCVMYLGKIVEIASAEDLYRSPLHPYTKALLSAVPVPEPGTVRKNLALTGEIPSPINPPSGCTFHQRCPLAEKRCQTEVPRLSPTNGQSPDHLVRCHLFH